MTTFANKKFIILKEMKRVLNETGKIILSVFSEDAFEEKMKVYKKTRVKIKEINNRKVLILLIFVHWVNERIEIY